MTNTITYIKEWQQALQNELTYLKKYGSNKLKVINGRLIKEDSTYTYYFEKVGNIKIPVGAQTRLEWGGIKQTGRILSSEGNGILLALDKSIGDLIPEAYLFHDPWELLEQLIERFDEIKKRKIKRLRIKKLMDPSMPSKHPTEKIKSNIHDLILRSKYNLVTFVWGPPGTGKTYTLARVAANKYFQDKRVLLLSHSNQAVDVLLGEICTFLKKKDRFREGDILRVGSNSGEALLAHEGLTANQLIEKQDPILVENLNQLIEERRGLKYDISRSFSKRDSKYLLEIENKISKIGEKIRQKEVQFAKDAFIVGTTLAKAASDSSIFEREFDVVILDEASMAYVPQAAFASTLGKRIIICGDFKQLSPIASSKDTLVTKWLKEDIFHWAGVVDWVEKGGLHPHLFLLKEQRRMHPDISAFTNCYIYKNLVTDHESVRNSRNQIVEQAPFPDQASILVDTSNTGMFCMNERTSNSRFNLWQLLLSFQLIHESYIGGARSIGYVTPYRVQANLMEMLLDELYQKECETASIMAATVHRFQGSEQDIMIFDTVDSFPMNRAGMLLTGKDSERLINVAITRTKGKFIHVSNQGFIRKHIFQRKTLAQLVHHQEAHHQTIRNSQIGAWIKNQHPKLQWMHAKKLVRVFQDICLARSSIIISIPEKKQLSDQWMDMLEKRNKKVEVTILLEKEITFPFVIIDDHLLWLGLPLEGLLGADPPYVAVRLDSEKVTNYLKKEIYIE
ncbi:MAG: AAA domain-containing protein [Bacillota bacterium]|nr:AAA domain-containing protein [Bacillota bacterium]